MQLDCRALSTELLADSICHQEVSNTVITGYVLGWHGKVLLLFFDWARIKFRIFGAAIVKLLDELAMCLLNASDLFVDSLLLWCQWRLLHENITELAKNQIWVTINIQIVYLKQVKHLLDHVVQIYGGENVLDVGCIENHIVLQPRIPWTIVPATLLLDRVYDHVTAYEGNSLLLFDVYFVFNCVLYLVILLVHQ